MICCFSVYCLDCKSLWLPDGRLILKTREMALHILDQASFLKKAAIAKEKPKISLGLMFYQEHQEDKTYLQVSASYDPVFCSIDWFKEHGEHALALQDEHGKNHTIDTSKEKHA